ncbi:MAG: Tc toxin subunit A, partial [Bacteroidota bacterium]
MSSSKIDRKKLRYVRGTVRNKYGQLLSSGTINVYDRDLRNRQLLGRSELKEGGYSIEYTAEKFMRADKESADVVVELVGGKKNLILHTSEVQFNVPVDFTYDISLGERAYQGPSDWEKTGQTLLPLLDGVDVLEIREDDKHQDVSFISAEAGVEPLLIGNWLACHHLEQRAEERKLELPAPFFYAFLKQGHPALFYDDLLADIQHPERVDLLLDKMLREITEVDEKLQRNLFEKALTNNLVPAELAEKADHFFRELDRLRDQYTGDRPAGAGKGTIREILAIDNEMAEVGDRFITAYAKHRGTPAQFWTKLEKEAGIKPETVTKLRTTFEVSGLTRNHVPLVRVLTDKQLPGRVLAGYDQQQWVKMLGTKGVDGQKVGAPDNIDGADEKERLVNYAIILERRFERQYPTAALSARLAPKMMGRLKQTKRIQRFLEENPDFQLDRYRIDHYLQENEGAGRALDAEGEAKSEIKALQRVFKIAPTTRGVTALLSAGVESAQQVYFMGPNRFSQLTESAGLTRLDSKRMFQRAENAYAMAVALFGNFNAGINGLNPFGISPFHLTAETAERLKALPDLQTLFGNMDFCACKHCRSVYGPAAHFVDVLRFLGERDSNGTTQNAGRSVRDVLLARRPDLGEIELSCENTNTLLPYIDLVNEILEDVVAPPDSPANRQTTLTAAELRAAPEHLNLEAYDVLAEAVYPHHLPFNLHELQRDAYLNHLGTPPAAFIERFSGPGLRADAAYLGIPEARLAVITGTAGSFTSADFWGYGGITGWVDELRSVSTFLHRATISYPELLQLLAVEYVNPNGRVTVNDNPDGDTANCDLTTFRLRFVTVPFLDRAHRFLRLWRALKLPMWTIGDLIADLGGQPSANFIQDLATRKRVKDRLDLDWDELRSCYRDIPVSPVNIYTDKGVTIRKGHYAELFLNPLLESTNPFPEDPTTLSGPISDWTTGILGALRISEEELDFLLAERGLNQTTATNLSLLSDLYRSVLLARSLRLTLHDLATLATVAGMDPFPTAQGTLNFLDIVDTVKSGPFSV